MTKEKLLGYFMDSKLSSATVIQFLNQPNNVVYACVDQTRSVLALDILALKKAFEDAKSRGVKLMYVTEITKDNVYYCKQLMEIASELRHLDGIKGNFYTVKQNTLLLLHFMKKESLHHKLSIAMLTK